MHVTKFIPIWLLAVTWAHGQKPAGKESRDVKDFFERMENVMDKAMDDSQTLKVVPEPWDQRYVVSREGMAHQAKLIENYSFQTEVADSSDSFHFDNKKSVYNSDEMEKRDSILDFEGYQEFVFRPLYNCDRYDAAKKYCVFFRQIGTTLTLGVHIGEGAHRGIRVYWYRCLKKKHMDNIIKEPLNKNFLPWNLNLGGTENELRISPITEMDLGNNYFTAELVAPRAYTEKYGKKPSIRFTIEPIHIDMGTLYHGEEIIIYARSFMELPKKSVSFRWSLFDFNDLEDLGLPSNMRLNADKSSVVIKELKTYQDQILTCKVYSNKEILLARRNFLFRGFLSDKATNKSKHTRHKRNIDNMEELHEPYQINSEAEYLSNDEKFNFKRLADTTPFGWDEVFPEIREISADLFYDSGKEVQLLPNNEPHSRFSRDEMPNFPPQDQDIPSNMHKLIQREISVNKKSQWSEESRAARDDGRIRTDQHMEKPRFEDVDSQTIATCQSVVDCNVYAICIQAPLSGQKFCQCMHGYNGNGIFCFSN